MSVDAQGVSPQLTVRFLNGNLMFIPEPLIVGHYESSVLTGSEWVLDRLLDGALQKALDLGRYPDRPTTAQVFINRGVNSDNPLQPPRPEGVVVVGLGDEGELDPAELASTVRQGVIAWAQRRSEDRDRMAAPFAMAATLLGSGGIGVSAAQSARQILRGVLEANRRLVEAKLPFLQRLDIIELYLDRATEAWFALREEYEARPGAWALSDTIDTRTGGLSRTLEASYRGAGYDMVSARTRKSLDGIEEISFIVDTRRARAEIHTRTTQLPLIRDLVKTAARENGDSSIGRTLFRLLVPAGLESFFDSENETVLQVDGGTAGIPWEMLDSKTGEGKKEDEPWAIRSKVIRKLQTASFRAQVRNAVGVPSALVIGEPIVPDTYRPLPNARAEAESVAGLLEGRLNGADSVRTVLGASAGVVIRTLFERDWRIIHIAGHGEPPELPDPNAPSGQESPRRRRGVVLSNGLFLGPDEISGMPVVPDLVFINCCYLAKKDPGELLAFSETDRPGFAATLADSLIDLGVRCVIAAGWAIRDDAAAAFAKTFYEHLGVGHTFIEAVTEARNVARGCGDNTWAAYQCYGDPNWRMRWPDKEASAEKPNPEATFRHIASPTALTLALGHLTSTYQFRKPNKDQESAKDREAAKAALLTNVTYLDDKFKAPWGGIGSVAEAFGAAWAQVDSKRAIDWYAHALAAEDGSATFRAAEQLGNLRVRAGEAIAASGSNGAGADVSAAVEQSRTEIGNGLRLLEQLNAIQRTAERESLCASALKRLALLEARANAASGVATDGAEGEAIMKMRDAYKEAETIARGSASPDLFYSALNGLAADLILNYGMAGWGGLDQKLVKEIHDNLLAKRQGNPDFWSSVGLIELRLYQALSQSRLAAEQVAIEAEYRDLYGRMGAGWSWKSSRDQLRLLFAARRPWPEEERRAGESLLELVNGFAQG